MAEGVCGCFAKYLLCIFNFVLFVIGGIILGVGIWLNVDKRSFFSFLKDIQNKVQVPEFQQFTQPTVISQLSYILLAVGIFLFIVSFLGCCGALQESKCLLSLYGILVILILVLEITAISLALIYKGKAEEETRNFLKSSIKDYYKPDRSPETDAVTLMWNHLMAEMSCCGVDNYLDFSESESFKQNATQKVPAACCVLEDTKKFIPKFPDCTQNPSAANSYYMKGCYTIVLNWIMDHINFAIYAVIGLILVELFLTILAFCLCTSLDRYYK